jgi:serine/threonine-protein kinase HipA
MAQQRVIEVVADWVDLGGPTLIGRLTATPARGKEVFAFEYDDSWLASQGRQQLDPAMALYAGPQYPEKSSAKPTYACSLSGASRGSSSGEDGGV